jgi:hypothetical protein
LLHTAGKLAWAIINAVFAYFNTRQPIKGRGANITIMAIATVHKTFADIAASRHIHAKSIARVLMDDAPGPPHEGAAPGLGQSRHIHPLTIVGKLKFAFAGLIKRRQATKQGRFARPGLTDNAKDLSRPQLKGDIPAADTLPVESG